jgi:hypothetical protein
MSTAAQSNATKEKQANGSEQGALSRARTRVSRACTRCRARKDKCDAQLPSCTNCLNAEQQCSYDPTTKKRGLPEGYVRAVEKLWAVTFSKIPDLEDHLVIMLQQDRETLADIWNHRDIGEELHSRWKDSTVFQELESFLASLADTSSAVGSKRKRDRDDDGDSDGALDLRTVLPAQYILQHARDGVKSTQSVRKASKSDHGARATFQLHPHALELLGRYFTTTHSWFPILDKPNTLRRSYEIQRTTVPVTSDNHHLAVLTSALALAAQQTDAGHNSQEQSLNHNSLSTACRGCLPCSDQFFAMGHVQALLLKAHSSALLNDWWSARRSVGLVSEVLRQRRRDGETSDRDTIAARQGCVVLDTLISIRLEQRPHLQSKDFEQPELLPEDGHEEWEPWPGSMYPSFTISSFNCLTRLCLLINEVANQESASASIVGTSAADGLLARLETLAASHSVLQLSDLRETPPHQVFLHTMVAFARALISCRRGSDCSITTMQLASIDEVLRSRPSSVAPLPPLMLTCFSAILHGIFARLAKCTEISAYNLTNGDNTILKSLIDFIAKSTISETVDDLQRGLAALMQKGPNGTNHQLTNDVGPSKVHQSRMVTSPQTFFPADPFAHTNTNYGRMSIDNPSAVETPGDQKTPQRSGSLAWAQPWSRSVDILPNTSDLGNGSFILPTGQPGSTIASTGTYNASIATSPSFQGDEIDALFHEMAQLDTTEWTAGRNEGLRDFGFDDSTFEQFCNDPDRLFSSGFAPPLPQLPEHNPGDAGFPLPDLLQHSTQQPAFDMPSWNG